MKTAILILWPSFIVGGVGEVLFFTVFDPQELYLFGEPSNLSKLLDALSQIDYKLDSVRIQGRRYYQARLAEEARDQPSSSRAQPQVAAVGGESRPH